MADHDPINKFVVHRFNYYVALNARNYHLWNGICIDYENCGAKHLNNIGGHEWTISGGNCYEYKYYFDYNFGSSRTHITIMMKAVNKK